ncbi:MAG: lactate utilization protein [Bacteroidetes bacterium]|nr:lactate utilization protein [Bacteroidota bacterium]
MSHAKKAAIFNKDEARTDWHDASLWMVRQKRDFAVSEIPEWEFLREYASDIKTHTLSALDTYLEAFEKAAIQNGATVHWASDATEHNEIVLSILKKHQAKKMVKSKSMLTEECQLNDFLAANDIEVIDSDLGERIIQLLDEPPSHIVLPAIHLKKEEIGELFHRELQTEKGATDPQYLTEAARHHLREKFHTAQVALTGVNFGIAETGEVVVCTNEGNADMGVHLTPVHIHSMGIEKLIPRRSDLAVFTRLLARSATGQPVTVFTSHHRTPKNEGEMHIILVDNGRTNQLGKPDFRGSLKCIRCGACMNTCPIYRRSGGHSYDATIPGPIGSILTPGIDLKKYGNLPFASTLCGSCTDVCPVKIDIHTQLYKWRQIVSEAGLPEGGNKTLMGILGNGMAKPGFFHRLGNTGRKLLRLFPGSEKLLSFTIWTKDRNLPKAPKESFRDWYAKQEKNEQ